MDCGFVFLDEVLRGVRWDAKYATWDNFTGTPVEGYDANRIVGSCALAGALLDAKLRAEALGFGLDTGEIAPMGGGHDLMDARSHHGAQGISAAAAQNRGTLCSLMEASGFERYAPEWWHYVLRQEPYPDTYFDFPIS